MRYAILFLSAVAGLACATAKPDAGPRPINGEAAHIVLLVNGKPSAVTLRGRKVYAIAKGQGEIRTRKGGAWVVEPWRCTFQLWRTDESGWMQDGPDAGVPCGDVAETWVWPGGMGKEFTFVSPGAHEICVEVHTHGGYLIGPTAVCASVVVVGGEQ